MERVVVLTVDEVSVLIGLLDTRWSGRAEATPHLADMARRYEALLWTRVVDAPELLDMAALRARNEELVVAVRAALEVLGTDGPLAQRPSRDPDLVDVRALLAHASVG